MVLSETPLVTLLRQGSLQPPCTSSPFPSPAAVMMFTKPTLLHFSGPCSPEAAQPANHTAPSRGFCSLLQLVITLLPLQQALTTALPLIGRCSD